MKINIVTIHYTKNIGGCLQALALQEHLKRRYKSEVRIVDYRPAVISDIYAGFSIPKYCRMAQYGEIQLLPHAVISDVCYAVPNYLLDRKFELFYKRYYSLTNPSIYEYKQLKVQPNKADILMTGSDQVWNDILFHGFDSAYFLKFGGENQKRIAYAASIGNDSLTEDQLEHFKDLLSGYQYISTREKRAQKLLQPVCNCKIENVLDPTLLLTGKEWLSIFNSGVTIPDKPYIFFYTINWSEEARKFTEEVSQRTGLPVVTVLARKKFTNELMHYYRCTPDDFTRLISGARYVVTNSFHGTVFSILFFKQFWTFLNPTRNSRILDLLTALKIESRAVTMGRKASLELSEIDYKEVHERLRNLREQSNDYLDRAIGEKGKTHEENIDRL